MMRTGLQLTTLALLLSAASASSVKALDNSPVPGLQPRQDLCEGTCKFCFGSTYEVCGATGGFITYCFDPAANQVCCGNGQACDTGPDCCGSLGFGITLIEEPSAATSIAISEPSSAIIPSPVTSDVPQETTTWSCRRTDSNEECCQRGSPELTYCSGSAITQILCYDPADQYCCSNGEICDSGPDCCSSFGAVATTPDSAAASSTPGAEATDTPDTPATVTSVALVTRTSTRSVAGILSTTTRSASSQQTVSNGNAGREVGGAAAVAAGVLGLVML